MSNHPALKLFRPSKHLGNQTPHSADTLSSKMILQTVVINSLNGNSKATNEADANLCIMTYKIEF